MLIGIARFVDLFHESCRAGVFVAGWRSFSRTALTDLIFNFVPYEFRMNSDTIAGRTYAFIR